MALLVMLVIQAGSCSAAGSPLLCAWPTAHRCTSPVGGSSRCCQQSCIRPTDTVQQWACLQGDVPPATGACPVHAGRSRAEARCWHV